MSKEPYNYKGEVFHSPIVKVRWMGCKCVLPSVASGIEGGAGGGEWGLSEEPYNSKDEILYSSTVKVRRMKCNCVFP